MLAWISIIIAALFECAWTFSVRYFKMSDLKLLTWNNFYLPGISIPLLAPLLGYILFGLGNVYFFSIAMKDLSAATAFGAWTAFSLIFIKLAEVLVLRKAISWPEAFFMLLIMAGVVGLKCYAVNQA
jgi:quaternary ammonium compound-resistance protein SugE